jgi:hypothetical protein
MKFSMEFAIDLFLALCGGYSLLMGEYTQTLLILCLMELRQIKYKMNS